MLDELDTGFVTLKVVDWVQAINSGSKIHHVGMTLRAHCVVWQPASYFKLTNQELLQDLPIELSAFPHQGPEPVKLGNGQPLERGIGLFRYLSPTSETPPSLSGWFALSPEHYQETWRQVTTSTYTECSIQIEVAPVDHKGISWIWDIEKNSNLYLLAASIAFKRALPVADYSAEPQASATTSSTPERRKRGLFGS